MHLFAQLTCGSGNEDPEMTDAIDSFVFAENVSLYKTLLKKETHSDKRRILSNYFQTNLPSFPSL